MVEKNLTEEFSNINNVPMDEEKNEEYASHHKKLIYLRLAKMYLSKANNLRKITEKTRRLIFRNTKNI